MGTLALIIIIFSLALYLALAQNLMKGIDSSLETVAKKRKNDIMEGLERTRFQRIDEEEFEDIEELDEVKDIFTLVYCQLLELSVDGPRPTIKMIVKSNNLNDNVLPYPTYAEREKIKTSFKSFIDHRLSDSPLRLLSFPFKSPANTYYILQYATTRKEAEKTLNTLLIIILVIDPILLILSFFGGYFLVNKTLLPVKTVVSSAKKITAEDLSHRIPPIGSRDEIGELVDTFNDMIERLDRSFRKIKQFSSDVSHEFKTPLTIIRGEIDVALRKKRFKKDYIKTMESVHEEVVALQRVIENLLFLGGTESEGQNLPFRKVPLGKIVLEVFEDIQKIGEEKNIRFVLKEIQPIDIEGEATLLKRVFYNLFENAVKYTGEDGEVEILLEKETNAAKFSIKDTGIGITENELPHIFDRFYRVDKARSRRMGSAGLGLSIVRLIVQLHKGKVDVTSTPGKGSTFIVHLPLKF